MRTRDGSFVERFTEHTSYGWRKIIQGCYIANSHGLEWLWLDTCCVDKSSSAELSEAINSMYKWYRTAKACYVFLPDVSSLDNSPSRSVDPPRDEKYTQYHAFHENQFLASEWFSRAWTLQELLAPSDLRFFNCEFQFIGTKAGLSGLVAARTKINRQLLQESDQSPHQFLVGQFSIADRMTWAADREATRQEDIAYCLLGIFDVNMPLLYGEGGKAFLRLQLEIMKKSEDETIFAWGSKRMHAHKT